MKCPRCNSTRITKHIVDGFYIISCGNCGYLNKREINGNNRIPKKE